MLSISILQALYSGAYEREGPPPPNIQSPCPQPKNKKSTKKKPTGYLNNNNTEFHKFLMSIIDKKKTSQNNKDYQFLLVHL